MNKRLKVYRIIVYYRMRTEVDIIASQQQKRKGIKKMGKIKLKILLWWWDTQRKFFHQFKKLCYHPTEWRAQNECRRCGKRII